MSEERKKKGLKPFVIILALTNILSLAVIWFMLVFEPPKEKQPLGDIPPHIITRILKDEIKLSDSQIEKCMNFIGSDKPKTLHDSISIIKRELIPFMFEQEPDTNKINLYMDKIAKVSMKLEKNYFNRFKRIANVCNLEQKEKFKKILYKITTNQGYDRIHKRAFK